MPPRDGDGGLDADGGAGGGASSGTKRRRGAPKEADVATEPEALFEGVAAATAGGGGEDALEGSAGAALTLEDYDPRRGFLVRRPGLEEPRWESARRVNSLWRKEGLLSEAAVAAAKKAGLAKQSRPTPSPGEASAAAAAAAVVEDHEEDYKGAPPSQEADENAAAAEATVVAQEQHSSTPGVELNSAAAEGILRVPITADAADRARAAATRGAVDAAADGASTVAAVANVAGSVEDEVAVVSDEEEWRPPEAKARGRGAEGPAAGDESKPSEAGGVGPPRPIVDIDPAVGQRGQDAWDEVLWRLRWLLHRPRRAPGPRPEAEPKPRGPTRASGMAGGAETASAAASAAPVRSSGSLRSAASFASAEARAPAKAPVADAKERLPEGWKKVESKSSVGKSYYFHKDTGETSWELPEE